MKVKYSTLMTEYYTLQDHTTTSVTEAAEVSHCEQSLINVLKEHYRQNNEARWEYLYCPYFTEQETQRFTITEGLMTSERPIKQLTRIQPTSYGKRIKDLETQLRQTEDPEEINKIQSMMKAYGWDPSLEFNEANQALAERRILNHYNQELKPFYFIDASAEVDEVWSQKKQTYTESVDYGETMPVNIFVSPFACCMCCGDKTSYLQEACCQV